MNIAIDPSKKSFSDINQSSVSQRDAEKTNMAVGTTPTQAVSVKSTAPENSSQTTLRNQQEQEIEMASAAAREKQLRNQTAAVFNRNTDLVNKLNTDTQRDSAANSPWCNCENCQTA